MAQLLRRTSSICITASLLWSTSAFAAAPHDFGRDNLYLWVDVYDTNGLDLDNDTDLGAVYAANGQDPAVSVGAKILQIYDKSATRALFQAVIDNKFPPIIRDRAIHFADSTSFYSSGTTQIIPYLTTINSTAIFYAGSLGSTKLNETRAYAFYAGPQYDYRQNGYTTGTLDRSKADGANDGFGLSPNLLTGQTQQTLKLRYGKIEEAYPWPYNDTTNISVFHRNIRASENRSYFVPDKSIFTLAGAYAYDLGPTFVGRIAELIVTKRELSASEEKIMRAYFDAKFPANNGTQFFHLGGIGMAAVGDSVTRGTSAGLALSMDGNWSAGSYLTAKLPIRMPPRGLTTSDVPTAVPQRSQRIWVVERTGAAAAPAKFWFNLDVMGMPESYGKHMYLLHRSSSTGAFTKVAEATANDKQVEFALTDPQPGEYALGSSVGYGAPAVTPVIAGKEVVIEGVQNPKLIPGALLKVTVSVSSTGTGMSNLDSVALDLPVPDGTKLYLGDIAATGSGPVSFTQGTPATLLSYDWQTLTNATDGLEFSSDGGTTWAYSPTIDGQKGDGAINKARVRLKGYLNSGIAPNFPNFQIKYGLIVK